MEESGLTSGWRKSNYSNGGSNCVEAGHVPGSILIRDTKDSDTKNDGHGPVLRATPPDWRRFTASLRSAALG
jgi:hypothetical protein